MNNIAENIQARQQSALKAAADSITFAELDQRGPCSWSASDLIAVPISDDEMNYEQLNGEFSKPLLQGRIQFHKPHEEFWDYGADCGLPGQDYAGDAIENPTGLDLFKEACRAIATTGDWHHVFLESITHIKTEGDVQHYKMEFGS